MARAKLDSSGTAKYSFLVPHHLDLMIRACCEKSKGLTPSSVIRDVLEIALPAYQRKLMGEVEVPIDGQIALGENTKAAVQRVARLHEITPTALLARIVTEQLPTYHQQGVEHQRLLETLGRQDATSAEAPSCESSS